MIKLHHLQASRSIRILWLLEEIGQPYELISYQRDAKTHLAPQSLKSIHPLGKSPVIELDGKVIAESGAIVELLIKKFAPHLAPDESSEHYSDYLQWLHFAESSAMLPLLLKVFNQYETRSGTTLKFLDHYAEAEFNKVFTYLNNHLNGKTFLIEERLSGADFMLAFVIQSALNMLKCASKYPHIKSYLDHLESLASYQKAMQIEASA
ncbi:MAG: glutathione S-transferase family protein [Gammaproteobacteria bacterium]|nr:glutathione S-transferase family protein [Gammaproteobacteria bacterium]